MPKPPAETILEIGAEGGSLTIVGIRDPESGWRFATLRNEESLRSMLMEEDQEGIEFHDRSGYVASFAEALGSLDRYPWHRLCPIMIHPEFRQKIFDAVVSRFEADGNDRWNQLSRWKDECGISDS